jgi:chitin synthase
MEVLIINCSCLLLVMYIVCIAEYFNIKGNLIPRPLENVKEFDTILARIGVKYTEELNLSPYYVDDSKVRNACSHLTSVAATHQPPCAKKDKCIRPSEVYNYKPLDGPLARAVFGWDTLKGLPNAFVINGIVLDMTDYVADNKSEASTDPVDVEIHKFLRLRAKKLMDATREFLNSKTLSASVSCLNVQYQIGSVSKDTPLCVFSDMFFAVLLLVMLLIVLVKFLMAVFFSWFMSNKLSKEPKDGKGIMYQPAPVPAPARPIPPYPERTLVSDAALESGKCDPQELYTAMLVTCYSEGEEGLRCTLDSLAATTICDQKKLLFVVADGIVTGAGNAKSTPDIILDIIEEDTAWGEAKPFSYLAVAAGRKRHNMARVHIGFYCKICIAISATLCAHLTCSLSVTPRARCCCDQVRDSRGDGRRQAWQQRQTRCTDYPNELL